MTHQAPFRSDAVLRHARGQRCTLRLSGICCHNPETTVSAHIRDRFKGMGTKASDHSIVFACAFCHRYLDEQHLRHPLITDIELLEAIIRGLQETWAVLIADEIIPFPHNPPPKPRPPKPRLPKAERQSIPSRKAKMQSRPFQKKQP